jgi:hypothetical protein
VSDDSAKSMLPSLRQLLIVASLMECLTALALILQPGITVAVLMGSELEGVGLDAARIAGLALLSLSIACWGARSDLGGPAKSSSVLAIVLYNAGAGALFTLFGVTGQASGAGTWCAAVLHLVLTVAFVARLRADAGARRG